MRLRVLRREHISPNISRVTLGEGDIDRFRPMGFDQWFRLYLPVATTSLDHVPAKMTTASYARFLTVPASVRPVLRNYTVRAHRPGELDVDVVLHGSAEDGTAGPATTWGATCSPGDEVALFDEGTMFNPVGRCAVALAADETGLPAAMGVLRDLPRDTRGWAVIEVPHEEDRQEHQAPAGVEVTWVTRGDDESVPGRLALAAASAKPLFEGVTYGWVVGESGLATGLRGHWVRNGLTKGDVTFSGYYKYGHRH